MVASATLTLATTGISLASEHLSGSVNGNVQNGEHIFKNGKGDVPACTSCHGEDGTGNDAMGTPRLAGQGEMFIYKQLTDFANDKRSDTTMYVMNANAKGLSDQDRRDVATYLYSRSEPYKGSDMAEVKDLGTQVGVRYLGQSIAQHGAPKAGVPACHSCHGYNGRGAPPMYPVIGGQRYVYLVNQLKKWRDGSRSNDVMGQMRAVAKNLSDEDIHNVATFLTSAPRTTVGNTRVPSDLN
jgi:cytochrome c553